jgi:hypothetical protein
LKVPTIPHNIRLLTDLVKQPALMEMLAGCNPAINDVRGDLKPSNEEREVLPLKHGKA